MNPEMVKRIDVIYDSYVVDGYVFPGLINIISKNGYFSSGIPVPGALRVEYAVTDPVPRFSSPEYTTIQNNTSRLPDFRNTMYWNPLVKPLSERNIKMFFYSSDYSGDFILNIRGLTGNGGTFSFSSVIHVINKVGRPLQ